MPGDPAQVSIQESALQRGWAGYTLLAAVWLAYAPLPCSAGTPPAASTLAAPASASALPPAAPTSAAPAVQAAPVPAATQATTAAAAAYTPRGADTCIRCHDDARTAAVFKTRHGTSADPRTPFAQLQCETCHGPGSEHAQHLHPGDPRPAIPLFGKNSTASVAEENKVCLSCHQDNHRVGWQGSVHDREGLACVSCHSIHAEHDPVLAKAEQPDVCYRCHQVVRADFAKYSAHPVQEGDMDCSSCHAPHDTLNPDLLIASTVNDTCYTCHADKRGPYLWEHAPVSEDCSLCHTPHGSVNPALLANRPPFLCQSCHSQAGHPSLALTAAGIPGRGTPNAFLAAGGCVNCHSQVHGSNDPSGSELNR